MILSLFIASKLLAQQPTYILKDVSIITPGSEVVAEHQDVALTDKILWIKPTSEQNSDPSATTIDAKGKFLIPGLWDMHVHLSDEKSLGLFTANGVTGVRVLFGNPTQLFWRNKIKEGKTIGPQMVLAGPIVDGPKPIWPGSIAVSTPEQARAAVQKIKKDGYDFVKVYSLLSRECYFAIADECKKQNIDFAGHVPHSVGILEAQAAGQRTSEHIMGVELECSDHPQEYRAKIEAAAQEGRAKLTETSTALSPQIVESFSQAKLQELINGLAKGTMWQCPTLVVLRNIANLDQPGMGNDAQNKYVMPFLKAQWDPKNDFRLKDRKPADWERSRKTYNFSLAFTSQMIKANVKILAGTDCLNPYVYAGYSLHEELALLVEAGMTPTQALATATINPSQFFGQEKTSGTVDIGKTADLVLLDANPLTDINNTLKINTVFQKGTHFDRAALDKVLKDREYK